MFIFIYYFNETIKNCFSFFIHQNFNPDILVKTFTTQNKYLTPRLKEDSNIISARSAAKSLSLKYTFLCLNFLITGFSNS